MKIASTIVLRKINADSRRKGFSRTIPKNVEKLLDSDGFHVLSQPIVHGDGECIRATVVMLKLKDQEDPVDAVLDLTFEQWNKLPEGKEVAAS